MARLRLPGEDRREGESSKDFKARLEAMKDLIVEADATYLKLIQSRVREPDADGNLVVNLFDPVTFDSSVRSTLTVRPIRVKDVRRARLDGTPSAYADCVVQPKGAFDELTNDDDFQLVIYAVGEQLKKYQTRSAGPASS